MNRFVLLLILAFAGASGLNALGALPGVQPITSDWRTEWATTEGFLILRDSEGYNLPTAIAVVPQPGPNPKDPRYFVTELRGKVRVVTNDRTVHTFAENFFQLTVPRELPHPEGENGLAGICLDAERGYVFVTFAYQDKSGVLRNDIARFSTTPRIFSVTPTSLVRFSDIFSKDISVPSHQIGGCQVESGHLYVSVGDGQQPRQSQQLQSTLGKILRLPLSPDGRSVPDNPFYEDSRVDNIRNHIWAYGFRNPFGIKVLEGRVFLAENGVEIDRFLEAEKGRNYKWTGSDWAIGMNAGVIFTPAISPVQLDYYAGRLSFPQEYDSTFFLALAADTKDPLRRKRPGIVTVKYDFNDRRVVDVPLYFLEYRGHGAQMVVGVGLGRDGLYFVPLYPDSQGESAVYRVVYDRSREHPIVLGRNLHPSTVMRDRGCFGCHSSSGYGGTFGPPLDSGPLAERLRRRLHSSEYLEMLAQLQRSEADSIREFRPARQDVMAAKGLARVRVWLRHKIQNPRFDSPSSQMPTLGVPEREASVIADHLLRDATEGFSLRAISRRLPSPRHRHTIYAFFVGVFGAFAASVLWRWRRA